MSNELALQKLNELKEAVDGELEEMVDVMSKLVVLQQDISNPMFGAQVTYYEKPDGKWVEVDPEECPFDPHETYPHDADIDDSWAWSVARKEDDGEKWVECEKYMVWEDEEEVSHEDLPDIFDPDEPLEDDLYMADEHKDEWTIYDVRDRRKYKRKRLVDHDGLLERKAIVFEPHIAEAPPGDYWDPNKEEFTTPGDYPMGTVNVVVPKNEDEEFGEDYVCDIETRTSVTPAKGQPGQYEYTPGWE